MMPPKKKNVCAALLFGASTAFLFAQTGTPAAARTLRNHFDADIWGSAPAFFDFLVLGAPGQADWKVAAGSNPPSPPNHVTQVIAMRPVDSIAVAVRRKAFFRDGALSLALQKGSGRGGLVFRLAGERDFVALLVELTTGEARLTAYKNGRPVELARGKASLDQEWGFLSVAANGPKITAAWNGKPLLDGTDPHPATGRAGMATEGPGSVSFDEFVLEPGD